VDEFHEEAMVHILKVFDSKAAELLGSADLIPRKKALRAIAVGIAGPEESAVPCIKQAAHTFRKKDRGHVVNWQAAEDGVDQNNTATRVEKLGLPPSQIAIKGVD